MTSVPADVKACRHTLGSSRFLTLYNEIKKSVTYNSSLRCGICDFRFSHSIHGTAYRFFFPRHNSLKKKRNTFERRTTYIWHRRKTVVRAICAVGEVRHSEYQAACKRKQFRPITTPKGYGSPQPSCVNGSGHKQNNIPYFVVTGNLILHRSPKARSTGLPLSCTLFDSSPRG